MTKGLSISARRAARIVGFGGATAGLLSAFLLRRRFTAEAERDALQDRWIRRWSAALLRVFAVKVLVHGEAPRGGKVGAIVVANHRSTIDIAALLHTFGGHLVSRKDLAAWPLVGVAARSVGTVFVDREDAHSGAAALRAMRGLLERGRTVSVFAEGTTFPDDEVRPFQPGAFMVATKAEAPILPVGLAYERGSGAAFVNETFGAHLARMSAAAPTRVVLCVGAPIPVTRRTRPRELRDQTHAAVQSLVNEARALCDAATL